MNLKLMILPMMFTMSISIISTNNPLTAWMIMEMMSFMMFAACSVEKESLKSIPFLMPLQFIPASLMLMSIMTNTKMKEFSETMIVLSVMMKTGMFPFSSWMISTFKEMSWNMCMIMMTTMKLPPMVMLMMIMTKVNWLMISANILSPIILTMKMMPISSPKVIMAMSSGIQSSWMTNCMMTDNMIWMLYFLYYIMITMMIIISMNSFKTHQSYTENPEKSNKHMIMSSISMTMSMMGMPPTMMFTMKAKALMTMAPCTIMPTMTLIISSTVAILFYSRIWISNMLTFFAKSKKLKMTKTTLIPLITMIIMTSMMMSI